MARWKRASARGAFNKDLISEAPLDWPARVTEAGLPPKEAIFRLM